MKIITVRGQIREVAGKWKYRYTIHTLKGLKWRDDTTFPPQAIYERLLALDVETATPGDVAAVIGNDTWIHTSLVCNECGKKAPALAEYKIDCGAYQDGVRLCACCLRRAADELDRDANR